mmetsp:Transcript_26750/g.42252  ORF Transcript_26750/g.42252 Transcript_26750/m.42252 type:complete len:229 (+) Transcript_26750:109-795(+)|eukprot:CAMPEP_0201606682 /NCGR_PEP_ID=MMETSP0492-20130828/6054_1 /ASSEMBLY_ACC=CAM_ASM_000837 /TAXON_ID=420259 /ORGANISM="Thalassiosira gravida, Strain GMp14c1" /LENGTH=228 /DNA_ID=CAMNT_0048071133 /DNA_START=46 /DNA_END=732 /DNA_ORIENTATION=+
MARTHSSSSLSTAFLLISPILLLVLLTTPPSFAYTPPLNKGIEIRVCQDKDCLLDGSKETLALLRSMTPSSIDNDNDDPNKRITIAPCACLGPCGSGPTVDFRKDGIRLKDTREGRDNYFLFREIDSPKAVVDMLAIADVNVLPSSSSSEDEVMSTRQWYELDRNSRITLQRILYALVALPLLNARLNGTWDVIGDATVPNSYYAIAGGVFVASQFMGTSQKSNSMEG